MQQRFYTLDVFRGMTVFLMIVVNTPGSGALPYPPLLHADWNGCTLTDLVFPSFLFAVGNAVAFVKLRWQDQGQTEVVWKIVKRSVLIFFVGVLLSWYTTMHWTDNGLAFSSVKDLRILAVLQRIGLCYLLAALMIYYLSTRAIVFTSVFLLLLYWFLLMRFGDAGQQLSIEGNLVRKIDWLLIGPQHMYRERGVVFDPEGLLSTLPATVNVLVGYLTGYFIQQKGKTKSCVVGLLAYGSLLVILGLLWNNFFPFNKKLWTSSYVLYTSGIAMLVIGCLFYFIEIKNWKSVAEFFIPMGKNPLAVYVLSNLLLFFLILPMENGKIFIDWIGDSLFQKLFPGPFGSLAFALFFTMICWTVAWLLHRKKIYIRL